MQSQDKTSSETTPGPATKKIRWGRILLLLTATVIVAAGAALTWLLNDTARVKGFVEQVVSVLTDRPFHINGDFDFSLGREITVTASEIKWDNAAWSSQPNMLTIKKAEVSIDAWSLYRQPLLITNVVASDAQLIFEWNQDKESNWLIGKPDKDPRKKPLGSLPILLQKADLKNIELRFRHPDLTEELVIVVAKGEQQQDASNRLVLDIDSVVDGRNIAVKGRVGPFPELIVAGAIDFELTATGPNAKLSISGDTSKLASLRDPDLKFDLTASEIAVLLDTFNLPEITHGALDLKGSLISKDKKLDGALRGSAGEFDVDATFQADSLKTLKGLSAQIKSQGPSASAAGRIAGIVGLPQEPYKLDVKAQDSQEGLKVDALSFATAGAQLDGSGVLHDFPALTNVDFDLQANVENISRFKDMLPGKNVPALPLRLDLSLQSNGDSTDDTVTAKARLGKADFSINGSLTDDSQFIGSRLDFKADLPDTLTLAQLFDLPFKRSEKLAISGNATVAKSSIELKNTVSRLGANTLTLNGNIALTTDKPGFTMTTEVSGPNLADLVSSFTTPDRIPQAAYKLGGKVEFANSKLSLTSVSGIIADNHVKVNGTLLFGADIPDINLDLSADGPNLSLALKGQGLEGLPTDSFTVAGGFQLSGQGIELNDWKLDTTDDQVQGSIETGWPNDPKHIKFDIAGKGKNLREVLPVIPGYTPAEVAFDIQAKGEIAKDRVEFSNLSAKIGSARLKLTGALDLAPEISTTGVKLSASGPQLHELGATDYWRPSKLPFKTSATLGGSANKLQVDDFTLNVGKSDMRGMLKLNLQGKPKIDLQLDSDFLNLKKLQSEYARDIEKAPSTAQADAPPGQSEGLIPDIAIPQKLLNSFDGSLRLRIGKLITTRTNIDNLTVDGTVLNGALKVSNIDAKTTSGDLKGELHIIPQGEQHRVELSATANNLILAIKGVDEEMLVEVGKGQNIDVYVTGLGNNLREVAASLNGYIWSRGGEQKIAASDLGIFFGDFLSQVLDTINPFVQKSKYQVLECSRIFFSADNGILQTAPAILLRTDKINIASSGTIDLSTEKIKFGIQTSPRKGLGLSASDLVNPFVQIQGTLAKPQMALNPTGTLVQGGAAVATLGISILAQSLYKRWLSPRDPCKSMTKEAFKIQTKRDPEHIPPD